MGLEFLEYLLGGLLYLISPSFREKKQRQWSNQSQMYKIYEVGMWLTIPFFSGLVIIVVLINE